MMTGGVSLTGRLQLFMKGEADAVDALLREILPRLHEIAVRRLKREHYIAPVSKTELIHEMWSRSLSKGGWAIRDREHFYALASLAMRRVLVDLARKRLSPKRGGDQMIVSLNESNPAPGTSVRDASQIVEIGILMEQLEASDPEAARIVDMHYFAGFTLKEISEQTGLSFRQVRARWEKGRQWLQNRLRGRA